MTIHQVARAWQSNGVSVIPILGNATKRPAVRWADYQVTAPTVGQIEEWWANGKQYGLALICGAVSGNLEMLELEGRATSSDQLTEIINRCDELGVGDLWDRLTGPDGYTQHSPSGGLHIAYRIEDHEVPGNTKIAGQGAGKDYLVLSETRGTGGYFIAAPSPGFCHPSGEPWTLAAGTPGVVPSVTWAERCALHEAIALALNPTSPPTTPRADFPDLTDPSPTSHPSSFLPDPTTRSGPSQVQPRPYPTHQPSPVQSATTAHPMPPRSVTTIPAAPIHSGSSPADRWEEDTNWAQILEPHGWTMEHMGPGQEIHWTRPGKDRRDGASATTGRAQDRDRLYVFSTSTVFQAEVPYTKFGAYALLNHAGDFKAAVLDLVSKGYGDQRPLPAIVDDVTRPAPVAEDKEYTLDDLGNGERFADMVKGRYRWVYQEKAWFTWSTERWVIDHEQLLIRAWDDMCRRMIHRGRAENDKALEKWGNQSRAMSKFKAGTEAAKAYGLTHSSSEFDQQRHKLNLENGTLDLRTGQLFDYDSEDLITHQFRANYAPAAECPNWESFMQRALPDVQLRTYVQRALGYSLLGDADQRAMFILYGPSGTGKSTMLETVNEIFGTYGTTAQAGTFKMSRNEKAPNNDLHELRGRRFVTTSETAENASFDEDLLKRVTGRDKVRSRALYQESVEWTPELTLWLATNNPPRLNSDDNAIWSRVKLIPFQTVFLGEGQVFDYARKYLIPEAAGILDWLLRGLADFQAHGLGEPAALAEYAREQRMASDSVARFVTDKLSDGSLRNDPDSTVRATEVFVQYVSWCRESGEKSLGSRRFGLRLESLGYTRLHGTGPVLYQGLLRPQGTWIIGGTQT